MNPFFSIIIPSYNSEKTLEGAVKSVQEQSFSDFEILIVDDASSDWSFALAHKLSEEDGRIRVLALAENNGAAVARNKGIEEALGKYILFLDSDDAYSPDLLKKVYAKASSSPDVIIWGNVEENLKSDGQIVFIREMIPEKASLNNPKSIREKVMDLEEASLYGYLWNKAYKAELAKKIAIPEQLFNEDEMYNIEFFNDVSSMEILSFAGTHYRKHERSLTHRELADYYTLAMKRVAALLKQQKKWGNCNEKTLRRLGDLYVRYAASAIERTYRPAAALHKPQRKLLLQRIFCSKLYEELIPYAWPNNFALRPMYFGLRKKNVSICLFIGWALNMARRISPSFFERRKSR